MLAQGIVIALAVYAGLGVLFAVPFVLVGVNRIDAVAKVTGVHVGAGQRCAGAHHDQLLVLEVRRRGWDQVNLDRPLA